MRSDVCAIAAGRAKRLYRAVCVVMAAALLATAGGCTAGGDDTLAATVNGVDIRTADVEALVKAMELKYTSYGVSAEDFYGDEASRKVLYDGVLESLIDRQLLYGLAEEKGLAPYTAEELATLTAEGEKELSDLRRAADNSDEVTLADMLAWYGCTEDNYVQNYIDIAAYNRAYSYLSALAEPSDADYMAYYDRMLENQRKTAVDNPEYLANYVENGTLLYYPEGAVYVQYTVIDAAYAGPAGYDAMAEKYGEQYAVAYPGTTQFSEAVAAAVMALAVGEESGRLADENGAYVFRRMKDPNYAATWRELPQSMQDTVAKQVGEAYIEECLAPLRTSDAVTRY